jgi:hypothetical protein
MTSAAWLLLLSLARQASPELGAAWIFGVLEADKFADTALRRSLLAEALHLARQAPEPFALSYRMGPAEAVGIRHSRAFRHGIDRMSLLARYSILARREGIGDWTVALAEARALLPDENPPACFDPMTVDYSWLNRALAPEEAIQAKFPFELRLGLRFCRPHEMYWMDEIGEGLYRQANGPRLREALRRWNVSGETELSLWFHEKTALLLRLNHYGGDAGAFTGLLAHFTSAGAARLKERRRLDWLSLVVHSVESSARFQRLAELEALKSHPDPDIALVAAMWGNPHTGRVSPKLR